MPTRNVMVLAELGTPQPGEIAFRLVRASAIRAHGWLGWSQTELAGKAKVSLSTVKAFEKGGRTIAATADAMRRAIDGAGIRLLEDQDGAAAGIARADAGAVRVSDRDGV